MQLQHKRATYILFEFKSSLKRESETRVNEGKYVGEENVKFLFLGLFRINFTPAFSRFSTSKSQSCWGPQSMLGTGEKALHVYLADAARKGVPIGEWEIPDMLRKAAMDLQVLLI